MPFLCASCFIGDHTGHQCSRLNEIGEHCPCTRTTPQRATTDADRFYAAGFTCSCVKWRNAAVGEPHGRNILVRNHPVTEASRATSRGIVTADPHCKECGGTGNRIAEPVAAIAATPADPKDSAPPEPGSMRDLLLMASAMERATGHTALALSIENADRELFDAIYNARIAAYLAVDMINERVTALLKGGA